MDLSLFKKGWLHNGQFDDRAPHFHNGAMAAYEILKKDFDRQNAGNALMAGEASRDCSNGERSDPLVRSQSIAGLNQLRTIRELAFQIIDRCSQAEALFTKPHLVPDPVPPNIRERAKE